MDHRAPLGQGDTSSAAAPQQPPSARRSHWASSVEDVDAGADGDAYGGDVGKGADEAEADVSNLPALPPDVLDAISKQATAASKKGTARAVVTELLGDEDDEDAIGDDAIMDPDNPLMKRVQDALLRQLTEQDQKLTMEIKDKEEACRKTVKKREEIGVELYNTQQQLARLQAMLEGAQDNMALIKNYREESERTLSHTALQHTEERKKKNGHKQNLDRHKQELESISRTLKQVDLYNEELRSKILVAKRTTLKAEDDIVKAESEKKRQDYYIDHLTDQLRRLQERRALYETQLIAQQKETTSAMETLQDAATEMDAIHFEKRQLLHQWKSSLIGLQRRDEVLENVEKGIQRNKDTLLNLQGEINGFRLSMRKTQEQSETLTLLLGKLEGEVEHLKRQIASVSDQRDVLMDQYSVYSKTLQQTEMELAQVNQERQALVEEIAAVTKVTKQTAAQIAKIESDIAEHLQTQTSIEKGALGTKKDNGRLRATIHEKESTVAVAMNDLSTIKLETLNVTARIRSMKETLGSMDKELAAKNELIEKYEMEIRRRNDELGKKQGEMDLLNKKYDQLVGRNQDESMGPLEATIHNVTKLVQQKEKECTDLQQFWLRAQNELVAISKKSGELEEETSDLKMRLAVLSRKKAVLNSQFDTESKEIRDHQRNIRGLQNDMIKINTLLSKQSQIQSTLAENNLGLEQEFRARLKHAELESIRTEARIEELREEKRKALQGLVEAERQLMLWEKKIQLAKETQAALDPNIGATEIKEMSIEIHRMKLRYSSMLKLQEKMISEMEKSVFRRESIATRTKTKGKGGNQAILQKEIAELAKKMKQTIADTRDCENDIDLLNSTHEKLEAQLAESQSLYKDYVERESKGRSEINIRTLTKQLLMNETVLHQKQARRYSEYRDNKYAFLIKDEEGRAPELAKQKDKLGRLGTLLEAIMGEFPETKDLLHHVHSFLENTTAII
ncbi:hypothetical protein DFJ73DRAFT_249949 [Zopfochytrium polystomum]|nr:hypothetical protein DFJ73DRAFT_249949 [Zopfochytrium polystomum]